MERFIHSLKVYLRSERLLGQCEFKLRAKQIQFSALAGLVALFGLVMLTLAAFFALVPYWGHALSALAVGATDLALTGALLAYAGSLKPPEELGMVNEVRDMALSEMQEEVCRAEAELAALRDDVRGFLRDPLDTLLPGAVSALVGAGARHLAAPRKK